MLRVEVRSTNIWMGRCVTSCVFGPLSGFDGS